jgi:hypothetical protein
MDMAAVPDAVWRLPVFDASRTPRRPGEYLALCFEWVGGKDGKPEDPSWSIRHWSGTGWSRKRYTFDTGGYEEFEAVAWCELPCVFDNENQQFRNSKMVNGPHVPKKKPVKCTKCGVLTPVDNIHVYAAAGELRNTLPAELLCDLCERDRVKWGIK